MYVYVEAINEVNDFSIQFNESHSELFELFDNSEFKKRVIYRINDSDKRLVVINNTLDYIDDFDLKCRLVNFIYQTIDKDEDNV